jgi:hypothetical protein
MTETENQAINPPDKVQVSVVGNSHGLMSVYSNYVDALWTPHDIKLKFAELTRIDDAGDGSVKTNIYEERVSVVVSWVQAKNLLHMLADIVGRYEELNGEINPPKIP